MKQKENLIFLHIPKNGGMTLHSIINRKYPKEAVFDIKVIDNTRLNTDDFINASEEARKKIQVLKGHMLFGLHEHLIGPTKYITFLRKPEDRLISFYYYVKKRPQHRLYKDIFGRNLSFDDFIRDIKAGDLHNAQIRWISGLEHGSEEEMLAKALKNIENHFSFVGLLEHYNASLLLLSKQYGWGIPYYQQRNTGSYREKPEIAAEVHDMINQKNAGDLQLYEMVETAFLKKIKKDALFPLKMKQLKLANKLISSYRFQQLQKKWKGH